MLIFVRVNILNFSTLSSSASSATGRVFRLARGPPGKKHAERWCCMEHEPEPGSHPLRLNFSSVCSQLCDQRLFLMKIFVKC